MRKITTKILKIIVFIGIFVWYLYDQFQKSGLSFSLEVIGTGLALAALAYIGLSLFGFTLEASNNYLIAFVSTIVFILFVCFSVDGVISAIPWLTEDIVLFVIIVLTIICIVKDIMLIRTMAQIRKYNAMQKKLPNENQEES